MWWVTTKKDKSTDGGHEAGHHVLRLEGRVSVQLTMENIHWKISWLETLLCSVFLQNSMIQSQKKQIPIWCFALATANVGVKELKKEFACFIYRDINNTSINMHITINM